jgi:hypothetical protein
VLLDGVGVAPELEQVVRAPQQLPRRLWNERAEVDADLVAAAEVEPVRAAQQNDPHIGPVGDFGEGTLTRLGEALNVPNLTIGIDEALDLEHPARRENLTVIAPTVSPPSVRRSPNGSVLDTVGPATI